MGTRLQGWQPWQGGARGTPAPTVLANAPMGAGTGRAARSWGVGGRDGGMLQRAGVHVSVCVSVCLRGELLERVCTFLRSHPPEANMAACKLTACKPPEPGS